MRSSFEFSAGSVALDLVDTVSARAGASVDLIASADAAARWLAMAGFGAIAVTEDQAENLRVLREAVYQVTGSALSGGGMSPECIDLLNRLSEMGGFRPQWIDGALVPDAADPFGAALSDIAADALSNLDPVVRPRLRRCPECAMLFRDRSKPGRRRWCSSASGCGNRAKVRRHRANKKGRANYAG